MTVAGLARLDGQALVLHIRAGTAQQQERKRIFFSLFDGHLERRATTPLYTTPN